VKQMCPLVYVVVYRVIVRKRCILTVRILQAFLFIPHLSIRGILSPHDMKIKGRIL
jgi:hypothetical protein